MRKKTPIPPNPVPNVEARKKLNPVWKKSTMLLQIFFPCELAGSPNINIKLSNDRKGSIQTSKRHSEINTKGKTQAQKNGIVRID